MDVSQILLSATNCSGRGVRYKLLTPSERERVQLNAGKHVGPDTTILELRNLENRFGVQAMIVAYTKQTGFKDESKLMVENVVWQNTDAMELEDQYNKLFTAKDDAVLCRVYQKNHEVSESEVDAIMGKSIQVSV